MTSLVERSHVRDLVQIELAAVTGGPADAFTDDALVWDLGVDSIGLVEALIGVREQLLVELGRSADEVSDPPALPWIETVGDVISFVTTSIESIEEVGGGSPPGAQA